MEFLPYLLDALVLIFIGWSAIQAFRKGFVVAGLSFLPMLAALVAVRLFTPTMGMLLRKTPMFGSLADSIGEALQLDHIIGDAAMQTQTSLIENMKLPGFLKESLLENNNPVVYQLLDVDSIQEYIAGFLANICINIVSVLLVFVLAFLAVRFVLKALNLISKLPVLNFMNRILGLLVGLLKGLTITWMICFLLTFFQCSFKFQFFFEALEKTYVALPLYENNILLYFILTIFT